MVMGTQMIHTKKHFGFIGFGLIGGSIARALRALHSEADIFAYNYYENKPHPKLEQALTEGTLSRISTCLADFSCCDVLFLCAPVLTNIAYLEKIKPFLSASCILTDVGSVKGDIQQAVEKLGLGSRFIGGHPMTGSEKTGYTNSSAEYLKGCYYILTPDPDSSEEDLDYMTAFVNATGAHCVVMDARTHDRVTAGISHGPHVISAALVNAVHSLDDAGDYQLLAAGGFKDITRISSSSSRMWQNICLTNKDCILDFLDVFIAQLTQAKETIRRSDEEALLHFFKEAKEYRDRFTD